ncbi:hypothetical protein V6N12_023626 [Hibiscus sabdariffa]|uniref:RNase H type-1 domain-containing protein n=1 Tax=Hibiscus sabdariffa TaxID=183260 RepID=A0ABR2FYM1_9ROSI
MTDWDVFLHSALWNLWLRRNEVAFQVGNGMTALVFYASLRLQQECLVGRLGGLRTDVADDARRALRSEICWRRPPERWCKLNSDGAVAAGSYDSACGGVIHSAVGHWLIGYNRQLGICSVLEFEL